MTDMATTYHPELDESGEQLACLPQASIGTHALITEQQVLFNTAAAVALPPEPTRGWSDTVHGMASAFSTWLANAAQPPKPIYPKRRAWLETAAMSRSMDRL
jgi:hypothetical protein